MPMTAMRSPSLMSLPLETVTLEKWEVSSRAPVRATKGTYTFWLTPLTVRTSYWLFSYSKRMVTLPLLPASSLGVTVLPSKV